MGTVLFLVNTPIDMMKLGIALRSFAKESKRYELSKTHTKATCQVAFPFKKMFTT